MAKVMILFEQPVNPDAFESYYEAVHLPIARRVPNAEIRLSKVIAAPEKPPGYGQPYRVSEMIFESTEAMNRALGSEAWAEVALDAANLLPLLGKPPLVMLVE